MDIENGVRLCSLEGGEATAYVAGLPNCWPIFQIHFPRFYPTCHELVLECSNCPLLFLHRYSDVLTALAAMGTIGRTRQIQSLTMNGERWHSQVKAKVLGRREESVGDKRERRVRSWAATASLLRTSVFIGRRRGNVIRSGPKNCTGRFSRYTFLDSVKLVMN